MKSSLLTAIVTLSLITVITGQLSALFPDDSDGACITCLIGRNAYAIETYCPSISEIEEDVSLYNVVTACIG